jgi:hypothetical protein
MPAPVPVTMLTSPRPTPRSGLTYAPARPVGLSPLIDHLGPGYAVIKLPPPPLKLELARLLALGVGTGAAVGMLGVAPRWLQSLDRAGGRSMNDLMVVAILGVALAGFVMFAFAALRQGRAVIVRLRGPALPAGSITFRRPEALTDATDAPTVLRVAVHPPALSRLPGSRGHLRVDTTDGRVLQLLRGHAFGSLDHLSQDLRKHLLAPRSARRDWGEP